MMLNETTQKIDTMLEIVCKKFEKVAFEHSPDPSAPMPFKVDPDRPPISYRDYIKTFSWMGAKYNQKRTLAEIIGAIQKKMKDNEEILRKK